MTNASRHRWYHVDYGGVVLGLVFAGLSLTPSLIPRPIAAQGIIAGLSFAVGYLLGALAWFAAKRIVKWRPPAVVQRFAWWYLFAAWVIAAVVLAFAAVAWQNSVRLHVGAEPISRENWLVFGVAAFIMAFVCIAIGRGIRLAAQSVARRFRVRFERRMAPRRAKVLSALTSGAVLVGVSAAAFGLVFSGGMAAIDYAYKERYADPRPHLIEPPGEFRSVGASSAVEWSGLGRDGADILAQVPSAAQIEAVTGLPAREPLRVYVGIQNAPTPAERAQIAVAELQRLGAQDRDVVLVAATTGTGWLDPAAIDSLEYLHAGNTAIVAVQYADTPSWRSSLFQPEIPVEAQTELFDAVHAWWSTLPEDDRPALIVYGLSLGATGIQSVFSDPDDLLSRVDGAVFAGSPPNAPLWMEITRNRDAGSPVVRPVVDGGKNIRFFSTIEDFSQIEGEWEQPRIAYLQHGSDPVTWSSPTIYFREPEWLKPGQRSAQVSPLMHWIPIVSGFQSTVDFQLGQAVPHDAGHKYGDMTVDAWIAVTGTAPGLTDEGLQRVRDTIATYIDGPPEHQ